MSSDWICATAGKPCCLLVTRTPFHLARTHCAQLLAKVEEDNDEKELESYVAKPALSKEKNVTNTYVNGHRRASEVEIPSEIREKPMCKL